MRKKLIRILKQIGLFFAAFNYVKCLDCKWYNTPAEVYCNPPLGECIFERMDDDPENTKNNKESS